MRIHLATLLVATVSLPCAAEEAGCCGSSTSARKVFRDAVTHGQLVRHHENQVDPIDSLPPVEVPEEVKSSEPYVPENLMARSEVLQAAGAATLVPKRSVLHVPANLRGVLRLPQDAKLLTWRDFYLSNRGWIDTVEVTRAQAEGWEPLPEELVKSFEKRSNVVVSTFHGSPISVIPVPDEVAGSETAEKTTE